MADASYPDDLLYHAEHDWVRLDGDTVSKDVSYGEVESVKAVSDLVSPLSGEVLEVNQKVVDAPETVNEDPYGDGWLIRIRITNASERDELLDVAAYKKVVDES